MSYIHEKYVQEMQFHCGKEGKHPFYWMLLLVIP